MRRSGSSGVRASLIEHIINLISTLIRLSIAVIQRIFRSRVLLGSIFAVIICAFLVVLVLDFQKVKALAHFKPNITTKIYDKNNVLISELFKQKREVVPHEKIPENLVKALVAIEDNEFYEHFGVNPKGIVRAFFINIFAGRIRQGGSTITQQTAKILLTTRKRTIYRKIKEAFIALMMEMFYTKDEIITLYANQIFLGHGAYGVESAANLYFGKHVWELNLAECALIASLPSSPNRLSPIKHPKKSMARHRIVLAKMVELGFISVKEAEKAYLEFWPGYLSYISELPPTITTWNNRVDRAPWFTEHVRRDLINKFGEDMVFEKGLLVYTTLDIKKQEIAQSTLSTALERQTTTSAGISFKNEDYFIDNFTEEVELVLDLFDLPRFSKRGSRAAYKVNNAIRERLIEEFEILNYFAGYDGISELLDEYKNTYTSDRDLQKVEGCFVSINQKNGYIEAMVGGSEFSSINQLNRVVQSYRQPGSAIKPLLYSSAFESGLFTPATTVLDSPIIYLDHEGGDWIPENYEGEYYGLVRLRRALAMSINVISIRIAEKLGIDHVLKYYGNYLDLNEAEKKKRIPRNFSIALGSLEVSPLELARAYAIIANGGKRVFPISIRHVKDRDGEVLYNPEMDAKAKYKKAVKDGTIQVIKPATAQLMIHMLGSVINGGTGSAADPHRPAGGKTGTTNNWRDAWFVGFTPEVTTALWIGYDKMGLSLGMGQSGGSVAAPVWGSYMREAFRNVPIRSFPVYAQLEQQEVCAQSGKLPSELCGKIISELFIPGSGPEAECELCETRQANVELPRKGPKENITRSQKRGALKKFKKSGTSDILDDVTRDLLNN